MSLGNQVMESVSQNKTISQTNFNCVLWYCCPGLPDGVCNFVFGLGDPVGETICSHPEVRAISFTGSTRTGTRISQIAAPMAKKISLEVNTASAAKVEWLGWLIIPIVCMYMSVQLFESAVTRWPAKWLACCFWWQLIRCSNYWSKVKLELVISWHRVQQW